MAWQVNIKPDSEASMAALNQFIAHETACVSSLSRHIASLNHSICCTIGIHSCGDVSFSLRRLNVGLESCGLECCGMWPHLASFHVGLPMIKSCVSSAFWTLYVIMRH